MSSRMDRIAEESPQLKVLLDDMGFDLRQVTWGYQDVFYRIIEEFFDAGFLVKQGSVVTRTFFQTLSNVDKSIFDSVIKSYLEALRSSQRWMMRVPQLFERWSQMGIHLAEIKHFLGIRFFDATAAGHFGSTPADLEFAISIIHTVEKYSEELIAPLMEGMAFLNTHLSHEGIRLFVNGALEIWQRNPQAAKKYLSTELTAARQEVENMTRQVRVSEEKERAERMLRGLLGREVSVGNLGLLDSDDLIVRGTTFVACHSAVYLPEVFNEFQAQSINQRMLKTCVAVAAACNLTHSFTTVHGTFGLSTCRELFANSNRPEVLSSYFYMVEVLRVKAYVGKQFPGIANMLRRMICLQIDHFQPHSTTDILFFRLLKGESAHQSEYQDVETLIQRVSRESDSWLATKRLLEKYIHNGRSSLALAELRCAPMSLIFFPDMLYPLEISEPPAMDLMADLHDAENQKPDLDEEEQEDDQDKHTKAEEVQETTEANRGDGDQQEESKAPAIRVGYFYDEWDNTVGDYYRDWCCVREKEPDEYAQDTTISPELHGYADRVRRVFEHLKPEEVRQETRLLEGDEIHFDHFMEYMAQGPDKQNLEMRFYNKPLTRRRDVAVTLLLDLSGSTGNEVAEHETAHAKGDQRDQSGDTFAGAGGQKNILQVEKEAAFILASGLHALGDRFSIYGFTGTGRENCLFYLLKQFEDDWNADTLKKLLSVQPGSSTRIGPALRHTGYRLQQVPAKTRVLLLITDGKPCDQGYDTVTHYAQHDVRKAVQENLQQDIHTFCISTLENTPAEMELMFPNGRHLILDRISRLPEMLSHLYLRLTR